MTSPRLPVISGLALWPISRPISRAKPQHGHPEQRGDHTDNELCDDTHRHLSGAREQRS